MKNFTIVFKTLALCLALIMTGGWARGATNRINGNPTVTLSSSGLIYGTTGSASYQISIPCTKGSPNSSTQTFTFTGLPADVTSSLSIVTLTGNTNPVITNFTITSKNTTPAGVYNLTVSTIYNGTTYRSNTFTFTISPATLTYIAQTALRTYGEANPSLSGTVEGFVNNETYSSVFSTNMPTWTTSATTTSPAGNYYIHGAGLTASNYTFIQASQNESALKINPKPLTVINTIINDKPYDGTTAATIKTAGSLSGVVAGETNVPTLTESYAFPDKNAGLKTLNASCSITGGAGNYTLTQPSLTANITPKTLTVINTVINDKIYDGKTDATIKTAGSLSGVVAGETNVPTLTESYAFQSKVVGLQTLNANCSISGGGGNYTLAQQPSFSARINPKPLTVSGATVTPKVFDGNTSATITGGTLSGLVSGDESAIALNNTGTGTFSDISVGDNKPVTSNYSISGSGVGNYSFSQPELYGKITPPTVITWSGTTSTDWNTAGNWTPPYLPDATVDVTIANTRSVIAATTQAACKNLTIESSGGLTINAQGSLTVHGNLTNNNTTADGTGLSLLSDASNTGSLIVYGLASGSGSANVVRYMTPGKWHLVSSPLAPLSNETIGTFLVANQSIPYNKQAGAPTVFPLERAMRAYDGTHNSWGDFYKEDSSDKLTTGKGYSIRVKSSTGTQRVTFTGKLQPGTQTVAVTANEWSCVGNPYTSALNISGTNSFLSENSDKMPTSFKCVYVWNSATDNYYPINATSSGEHVQQGQAFMIALMPGNTSVSFTPAMQTHDVSLALKSTEDIWPTIQLMASGDSINSSTTIAFHDGMTPGLDPSYDAGLLSAGGPELYTRLVDDYGIPFDIQALPSDQYDHLVIPVGVDYAKGGEVTFSAKGMYLPSSCRPILEDRLTGIKTDLTDKTYTADLSVNTAGTGRFYLYTSYASTGNASHDSQRPLSAWVTGNNEINIKGQINNGAVASLFDLQGRLIVTRVLREGTREHFSLPAVNQGIYLLQVRTSQQVQTLKITIGK